MCPVAAQQIHTANACESTETEAKANAADEDVFYQEMLRSELQLLFSGIAMSASCCSCWKKRTHARRCCCCSRPRQSGASQPESHARRILRPHVFSSLSLTIITTIIIMLKTGTQVDSDHKHKTATTMQMAATQDLADMLITQIRDKCQQVIK